MKNTQRNNQGFSLVELLTVLGIMAILVGLTVPSIAGFRSTYNRKTAVDLVMSTIDQARVAALQSGENVYVVMALARDSGTSPDAIIVAGDPALGSNATAESLYTHWTKLPTNVRFVISNKTITSSVSGGFPSGATTAFPITATTLPPINGNPIYFYICFNSTGTVVYPTTNLELGLYEGYRNALGSQKAVGPSAKAVTISTPTSATGLFEVIRMSQYSGRTWMDISNL